MQHDSQRGFAIGIAIAILAAIALLGGGTYVATKHSGKATTTPATTTDQMRGNGTTTVEVGNETSAGVSQGTTSVTTGVGTGAIQGNAGGNASGTLDVDANINANVGGGY